MIYLKDNEYELEIEKGVYVYHCNFGNRTRGDPSVFIDWKDLRDPEAVIRLETGLAAILERFPGMVLEVKTASKETR